MPFFSGLKSNKENGQVAGTVGKRGVKVALCGIRNTDLNKTQSKFLDFIIHTTKNLKITNFKNYIQKIEIVLKIWRMRNLTFEGNTTIFKHWEFLNLFIPL